MACQRITCRLYGPLAATMLAALRHGGAVPFAIFTADENISVLALRVAGHAVAQDNCIHLADVSIPITGKANRASIVLKCAFKIHLPQCIVGSIVVLKASRLRVARADFLPILPNRSEAFTIVCKRINVLRLASREWRNAGKE